MPDWGEPTPDWVRKGRTGPNGPRYTNRADRRQVRRENSGCAKDAVVILASAVGAVVAIGYGLTEAVRAVL